jgi:hypothetical protein
MADKVETQFKGNSVNMANGLTQTFNLESGLNQTVTPAPAYFFLSHLILKWLELVMQETFVGTGTSKITASRWLLKQVDL